MGLAERLEKYTYRCPMCGCWLWTASVRNNWYGQISVPDGHGKHIPRPAHRVWWESVNGPIPNGMLVCHRCDVPSCVNPAHLFLGSAKDNTQDMLAKRRHAHGINHPNAKLSRAQVEEIRALQGVDRKQVGAMYGVTWRHIYYIQTGRVRTAT